jgi:anti-sigma factor RsiW
MPTRKQKRREAKSKRHEYEFVYVDDEGNEVEAPEPPARNGTKPAAKKAAAPARTSRRTPQPPSWQRAGRRALILGAVVFVLFGMLNKHHSYGAAALAAIIYTALFIPFTYALDRFAYRRWQAREQGPTQKR